MNTPNNNTLTRTLFGSTLAAIAMTVTLGGSTSNGGSGMPAPPEPSYYNNNCVAMTESAPTGKWFSVNMQTATPSGTNDGCVWNDEADKFIRWVAPSNGTVTATIGCAGEVPNGPENGWLISALDSCGGSVIECGWMQNVQEGCGCGEKSIHIDVTAGQELIFRVGVPFESSTVYTPKVKFDHRPTLNTPGDLNNDGVVDGSDLGILFSNWGT